MSKTSVKILGHVYEVESQGDELYISSLAAYLEQKLIETQKDTGMVDTLKFTTVTALNIVDELFRLRNTRDTKSVVYDKMATELIKVLDTAINETKK